MQSSLKKSLQLLALLTCSLGGIIFFAFQNKGENTKYLYDFLKQADSLKNEELFEVADSLIEKVLKISDKNNYPEILNKALEKKLGLICDRTDLELNQKIILINAASKIYNNNSFFLQYKYAVNTELYLIAEFNSDSVVHNHKKTLEFITINKDWAYGLEFNTLIAYYYLELIENLFEAKKYIDVAEKYLDRVPLDKAVNFYSLKAVIYNKLGDFYVALESAKKGLEIELKNKNQIKTGLLYEYNNIAAIYSSLEDFENAEKNYSIALDLAKEIDDNVEIADIMHNLGAVYLKKGDFYKALNLFQNSQQLDNIGIENGISLSQMIAECYIKFEKPDSALLFIEKAIILNKKSDYKKASTYEKLSHIYFLKGDYSKAIFYINQALEIDVKVFGDKHPQVAQSYFNLSNILFSQGLFEKALEIIQKSTISNSSQEQISLNILFLPNLKTAFDKDLMLKILRRKTEFLDSLFVNDFKNVNLIDVYNTSCAAVDMLLYINKSVSAKGSKKYWLNREVIPVFETAISYALRIYETNKDPKYLEQAFQLSERSKSILLMESLREKDAGKFSGIPDSLVKKEYRLNRLISEMEKKKQDAFFQKNETQAADFEKEILNAEIQLETLKKYLEQNFPEYFKLKFNDKQPVLSEYFDKIDDSTLLISYFEGENFTYVFSLKKNVLSYNKIELEKLREVESFSKFLSDIKLAIEAPENYYNKFIAQSRSLYQNLLGPVLKSTDTLKRLLIIPDGSLSYLPFEVLLTENVDSFSNSTRYSKLPYLIHKNPISYHYSAQLWLQNFDSPKQLNGKMLAMAPTYKRKSEPKDSLSALERSDKERNLRAGLIELPGAQKEIQILKNKYKGYFPVNLNASEKTWKKYASNYGILHFAMHGLVDESAAEFSSLAFSEDGDAEEDNFLYAYEIKQSDLKASMVVLSACETGIGKYQRGEGVVSIGRGFMYAGVPSVVMTLWTLNDQSAYQLIEKFYENLASGMSKDIAMQKAKIYYLENSNETAAHPALWACFVHLGDTKPIEIEKVGSFGFVFPLLSIIIVLFLILFFIARKFKKKKLESVS
jgi:CHAT domain-containing protein/Tfp pilus assembly protein PilF